VSVRARHGRDLGSLSHQGLLQTLTDEISRKGRVESH